MADADRNPISGLDPVYFPTGAVLERPVTDRPTHDTIDAIIDWLAGPAHHNSLSLAGATAGDPSPPHAASAISRRKLRLVADRRSDRADIRSS
jgi:hypothetical protein